MAAFLKTVAFNKADFKTPPLAATDMRTGQGTWVFEKDLQQEDCRITPVSEGSHTLVVGLRPAREGDLRLVFTLYSEAFNLVAREELSFPLLVAEYEPLAPLHLTPFPENRFEAETMPQNLAPATAEKVQEKIDPLIREKIAPWMRAESPELFKIITAGLVKAIWDMRQSRERHRRMVIREEEARDNAFGGKHRTYHEHRSS